MSRPAHIFTPADIDTLRLCVAGKITLTECALRVGTSRDSCIYRMERDGLGLPPASRKARDARQMKQEAPQPMPTKRDGWIVIAHKANREWVQLDGSPISIDAARAAADAGRATMAQRRIDGGFDLLFKVVA